MDYGINNIQDLCMSIQIHIYKIDVQIFLYAAMTVKVKLYF